jgi:hypothetical protein
MKPHYLRARPKWHERASRSEINEVESIDKSIADLRGRRGKIINRIKMRTQVWVTHHSKRAGVTLAGNTAPTQLLVRSWYGGK